MPSNDNEVVMNLLKKLPAGAKLPSISKDIKFLAAIPRGEEQADRGEVISHEQIKKEFKSWISK
jgi:predicted transcriptional regulator